MAVATPIPFVKARFFDRCGNVLAGGKVYTYEPHSTTPKVTYTAPISGTPNTNPITLDAAGEADIYLAGRYRIIVQDSKGVVVNDNDDVGSWYSGDLDSQLESINQYLTNSGDVLIASQQARIDEMVNNGLVGAGSTDLLVALPSGRNQRDKNSEAISVLDYYLSSDNGDYGPALIRALDVSNNVFWPAFSGTYAIKSQVSKTLTSDVVIDFRGNNINFTGNVTLIGSVISGTRTLNANAAQYATQISLTNTTNLAVGDLLFINTTIAVEAAWSNTKKDTVKIKSISGTTIELAEGLNFAYATADAGLSITVYRPAKATFIRPKFTLTTVVGQAMFELRGLHNIVLENPVAYGDKASFTPSTNDTRRMFLIDRCVGLSASKCEFSALSYPFLIVGGSRNADINGITANFCRHLVEPGDWAKTVTIENIIASDCYASVSAHPAFDVSYDNVRAQREEHLPNGRCVGFSLRNAKIHTIADNTANGPYFQNLAMNDGFAYLHNHADVNFENVDLSSPNRTSATLGVSNARDVTVTNVRCADFLAAVSGGVTGGIVFSGNNKIGAGSAPHAGLTGVRNKTKIANNPLLAAELIAGVYHIDLRKNLVDQSNYFLHSYGSVLQSTSGEPCVVPLQIHTNAFADIDNPAMLRCLLKLRGTVRHNNAGAVSYQERHFVFYHQSGEPSNVIFPVTPIFTSVAQGIANESLDISVGNVTQAGATQLGATQDFYVQFDVTLSSGRTNPFYGLTYELEMFRV